jgi:hypothetical protein
MTNSSTPNQSSSDILEQLKMLSASYTAELKSKMDRLDVLIGEKHWLTVGTYKESLLKNHLAGKVPKRYDISTGFSMSSALRTKTISKQTDIIIWDSLDNSPFYRDSDFVIVPPESVKTVIEVKSTLTSDTLKKALTNLDSYVVFRDHIRHNTNIYKCIFAYQLGESFSFPEGLLQHLWDFYSSETSRPNTGRLNFFTSSKNSMHWSFPWVAAIVVLGVGVVALNAWEIDGKAYPVFSVHPSDPSSIDNTYGFLEQCILAQLLDCTSLAVGKMDRPGMVDALLRNQPFTLDGTAHLSLDQLPSSISKIGTLTEQKVKEVVPRFLRFS